MPKKIKISSYLPKNFVIKKVIGPRSFKNIGNSGYFLIPSEFKNSKNLFIVDGEFIKKKELKKKSCDVCSSDSDVIYCPHHDRNICKTCCNKCPVLKNCPVRN